MQAPPYTRLQGPGLPRLDRTVMVRLQSARLFLVSGILKDTPQLVSFVLASVTIPITQGSVKPQVFSFYLMQ